MQKIKNLKKNKKGFTLIEIIVVLVILAILAAATIPSMIGFVSDARGKALIAEARSALIAAQAVVTEDYALSGTGSITSVTDLTRNDKFLSMIAPEITASNISEVSINEGVVLGLIYNRDGFYVRLVTGGGGHADVKRSLDELDDLPTSLPQPEEEEEDE